EAQTSHVKTLIATFADIRSSRPAPAQYDTPAESVAEAPPPTASTTESQTVDRTVKVSVDTLNRLMTLAGESIVHSRWIELYAGTLRARHRRHAELVAALDRVQDAVQPLSDTATEHVRIAQRAVEDTRRWTGERLSELDAFAVRAESLSMRLHREVLVSRLRPFGDVVEGYPRLVRAVARPVGKHATLENVGKETGVDRDMLHLLDAPLTHALRNAVD